MIEIVGSAAENAEEMVVAALDRAEVRQEAEMPLADQRGAIARLPEQRRQRGMARRQADIPGRRRIDRLLEPDRQPVLIAAGDQRRARRRADGRIGVGLGEPHPFQREAVDVRRRVVELAVATHIRVAEIVRQDEDDVRLAGLGGDAARGRQGERAGGAGDEIAARRVRTKRHRFLPFDPRRHRRRFSRRSVAPFKGKSARKLKHFSLCRYRTVRLRSA